MCGRVLPLAEAQVPLPHGVGSVSQLPVGMCLFFKKISELKKGLKNDSLKGTKHFCFPLRVYGFREPYYGVQ